MFDRSAFLIGFAACLISVISLPAASLADGPFISLLVGGVNSEDVEADDIDVEYDTGVAFAGQFGYKFNTFRLAGEVGYQFAEGVSDNNVNSEIDITRFTLNGYVDLPIAPNVGPYVGGGFGVANLQTGDDLSDDFEEEDTAFTWHGEIGLNVGLNDHFSLAPVYRYQWVDSDIGGQTEPLISHLFGVSLRYEFHPGRRSETYSRAPEQRDHRYDSGYTSYGSGDYYDRYDHYDDRHNHAHRENRKTPEKLERDRCGWKGPGCDDDGNNR